MTNTATRVKLVFISVFLSMAVAVLPGVALAILWIDRLDPEKNGILALNSEVIFFFGLLSLGAALLAWVIWNKFLYSDNKKYRLTNYEAPLTTKKPKLTIKKCLKYCFLMTVISVLFNVINFSIFHSRVIEEWQRILLKSSYQSEHGFLMTIISVAVLAPLWEEIVFRGILTSGLSLILPYRAVIVLVAIFWSLAHMDQYNEFVLAEIIIVGLALSVAYAKTRSLTIPILMHATNNLIAITIIYYYSLNNYII